MAFAGGAFGLTLEKFLNSGISMVSGLESETLVKQMLAQDAYTPNFDTHDFRADVTNEPGNSGTYSSGGSVLTTTEITVTQPAATQLKWSADNLSWTGATLTARGAVAYHTTGNAATDEIIVANTFGADVSSSGGTFALTQPANGLFYVDYA